MYLEPSRISPLIIFAKKLHRRYSHTSCQKKTDQRSQWCMFYSFSIIWRINSCLISALIKRVKGGKDKLIVMHVFWIKIMTGHLLTMKILCVAMRQINQIHWCWASKNFHKFLIFWNFCWGTATMMNPIMTKPPDHIILIPDYRIIS